jgi:MFS family permease
VRRVVVITSLAVGADMLLYGAVAPLLPHYVDELDLSKAQAGLLVGSYSAGLLLSALPLGFAAARLGAQPLLVAGLVLLAIASVAFGLANSLAVLVGARFVQGVGASASWTGALTWLGRVAPPERRGELIGVSLGAAVAGEVLGPALGSLASATSPEIVFSAFGVVAAAVALLAWRAAGARIVEDADLASVRAWARRPGVAASMAFVLVPSIGIGVFDVLVPLELDARGATAAAIGAVFITASLAIALANPVVGRWSDAHGRRLPIVFGFAAGVAGTSLLALSIPSGLYVVVVLATFVALGCVWAPTLANLTESAERESASQAVAWGIVNVAYAAGLLLGSLGGGAAAQASGDDAVLVAMAVAFGLALAGALNYRSPDADDPARRATARVARPADPPRPSGSA